MPDEPKKNQQKPKHEAKEQRKRRQGRQPPAPVEKKPEKQPEPLKEPEKPAYEPPGPEFYKNLKRETDEILKITEEVNTKYKKKEIQSNWTKYEIPVETYDEIDEQENMGADYEKLIQAPLSVGGHFQFKHEKSWDTDAGPSLYDKFFEINMDQLSVAISTIPFYERNNIDESIFNENDISSMNHRATKFKQKYYNDKKYNTPEVEAQEKILKSLMHNDGNDNHTVVKNEDGKEISFKIDDTMVNETFTTKDSVVRNETGESKKEPLTQFAPIPVKNIKEPVQETKLMLHVSEHTAKSNNDFENDDDIFNTESNEKDKISMKTDVKPNTDVAKLNEEIMTPNKKDIKTSSVMLMQNKEEFKSNKTLITSEKVEAAPKMESLKNDIVPKVTNEVKEATKNPIIESPEDLEKWLDDFLDG